MRDIGRWALANRKLINFLMMVMVVGGAYSFYDMNKLEDPEIKVKLAVIATTYPGASAHQVELEVTDVLEKSIRSMKEVSSVTSRSMNDVSIISVNLSTLVKNDRVDECWDILRRKVSDAAGSLPQGASSPVVMDDFGDVYGIFYALTSDGFSGDELGDYAELIKREVQEVDGVARVNIYAKQDKCINIELSQERMAMLGVHPAEALLTLSGQGKTVYPGYYESEGRRLRITVGDGLTTIDDIKNLLIQGHENDQVRLGDIALVGQGYEKPVRSGMRYDGQQAVGIAIAALSGTDITKVGDKVEERLGRLSGERLPAGISLHKVFYQPERVRDALGDFMINLIESIVIVVGILMLTMGFRSGVVIGTSLFVVVAGSFLLLNMFDGTLQRVSLASFVLAMGMLVDNAIVIIDGILVDLKRGKGRREALTAIGRKTAMPLLAATMIAVLAFLPIFLSPDTSGIYVRDLFIVLAVSLLLSWALALTQVPIQANAMLPLRFGGGGGAGSNKTGCAGGLFDSRPYHMLRRVLSWGLRHRMTAVGAAVVMVCGSFFGLSLLPKGFFPDMDYDQLYIEYKLPEGADSGAVSDDLASIEGYLLALDDVRHVTTSIGGTPARYNLVRSIADQSLSYGELIVDFTSPKKLLAVMPDIQEYLTAAYPQAYVRLKRYNLMYKRYPIEVIFRGPDPAVLHTLAARARDIMRHSDDVFLVTSDWEPKTLAMAVDYNQSAARSAGLSRQDMAISLLTAAGGVPAGVFYDGGRREAIYLKTTGKDGHPPLSLETTPVFTLTPSAPAISRETIQGMISGAISEEDILEASLHTTPLRQAAGGIRAVWEDPVVIRHNGQRAMRAQCNPVFGVGAEDARASIAGEIEGIPLPEGYTMEWDGERKASLESSAYLFGNLPVGIILIITILIMLFRDYKKPLIILCCIPLIMVGVVGGMLIAGLTFGFVSIVCVLGLIGMMVKNGIVLMDEISLQIREGAEPVTALLESTCIRFRPVMMASLTTILGMIPLLTDSLFAPGAVTIMGGLLFGTLITLVFVPVLYALFFRIKIIKR